MTFDPSSTIQNIDDHVTLNFLPRKGYYIFRNDRPEGNRYLQLDGTWYSNCAEGWFDSPEQALKAYEKYKPKPIRISLEALLEMHWESRDA